MKLETDGMTSERLAAYFIVVKMRELDREQAGPVQVVESLIKMMKNLFLIEDIELYFRISTKTGVGFQSNTEKGRRVVALIRGHAELPPCPTGLCEYDSLGSCRWCGGVSKA